jgi:aerobic carbon-monoxide dehydrogenase small subunit
VGRAVTGTGAPGPVPLELTVNGRAHALRVPPHTLLLELLRDVLGLRGTRSGCETSTCGACTVLLDGASVKSCTVLALQAREREVVTIEGVHGADGGLHPVQESFRRHHALQCGYCTPGMVMAALSAIAEGRTADEAATRRALKGNLCRCTGYQNIVRAVLDATPGQAT